MRAFPRLNTPPWPFGDPPLFSGTFGPQAPNQGLRPLRIPRYFFMWGGAPHPQMILGIFDPQTPNQGLRPWTPAK